ncbi:MAG: hypothetical protein KAT20_05650, partial [Desulfuromonadales bacterium]|nr:hypothetical protein [Desulfuromonadales bacterium]
LAEILKTMRDQGEEVLHLHPHPQTLVAIEVSEEIENMVVDGLAGLTLRDLVLRCQKTPENTDSV